MNKQEYEEYLKKHPGIHEGIKVNFENLDEEEKDEFFECEDEEEKGGLMEFDDGKIQP